MADRLERGLPELDGLIGLPWPVTSSLLVTEVHTPLLEGYAGIYHPDSAGIEISEDLDDLTILHEASHAWFNGELFDGRWINEGLADTYATKALERDRHLLAGTARLPAHGPVGVPAQRLAAARADRRRPVARPASSTATRPRSGSSSRS